MRFTTSSLASLTVLFFLSGCSVSYNGLKPVYPSPPISFKRGVDSLTPTLAWEAYPGQNVEYELRIFEEEVSTESTLGLHRRYPSLVYSRSEISGTQHKVEEPLKPNHYYMWAIKPTGDEHEWSSYDYFYFFVIAWGYGENLPYSFRTPSLDRSD